MFWTIALILLVFWSVGLVSSVTMGGFIHLLLIAAIVPVWCGSSRADGRLMAVATDPAARSPGSRNRGARRRALRARGRRADQASHRFSANDQPLCGKTLTFFRQAPLGEPRGCTMKLVMMRSGDRDRRGGRRAVRGTPPNRVHPSRAIRIRRPCRPAGPGRRTRIGRDLDVRQPLRDAGREISGVARSHGGRWTHRAVRDAGGGAAAGRGGRKHAVRAVRGRAARNHAAAAQRD